MPVVSIHASREGRDDVSTEKAAEFHLVSIHASREGRDSNVIALAIEQHVSIHASREGRDRRLLTGDHFGGVSIHASREGRDRVRGYPSSRRFCFNPRVP